MSARNHPGYDGVKLITIPIKYLLKVFATLHINTTLIIFAFTLHDYQ